MPFSATFIVGGGEEKSFAAQVFVAVISLLHPLQTWRCQTEYIRWLVTACLLQPACGIPLVSSVFPPFASLQGRSTPKRQGRGKVTSPRCLGTHLASVHTRRSKYCLPWNMSLQGSLLSKAHPQNEFTFHLKQRCPNAWSAGDLDKTTLHKVRI